MGNKVEFEIKEKILRDVNVLHKFIILLVNANDEPINGKLKLQKMMFLLSDKLEAVKKKSCYDADNYGPHSEILDKEAQYLKQIGVLTSSMGKIALTGTGKKIAQELYMNEDDKLLKVLNNYKSFLNDMTQNELLTFIYSAYPDMTKKSVEYENLKPHMEKHVKSLLKKRKITSERASELLKIPQYVVIKKMRDMNMIILR